MKATNPLFLSIITIIFMMNSCDFAKKPYDPQGEFQAYIASFSQILPEKDSPLRITLAFKVNDSIRQDALITNGLFIFDPPVVGEAVWVDEHSVVFTPSFSWPSGKRFVNVSFFG